MAKCEARLSDFRNCGEPARPVYLKEWYFDPMSCTYSPGAIYACPDHGNNWIEQVGGWWAVTEEELAEFMERRLASKT